MEKMKREYYTKFNDIIGCQTLLDEMGEKGWELVCTQPTALEGNNEYILRIFKRPIKD